jgi:hypothetical protein
MALCLSLAKDSYTKHQHVHTDNIEKARTYPHCDTHFDKKITNTAKREIHQRSATRTKFAQSLHRQNSLQYMVSRKQSQYIFKQRLRLQLQLMGFAADPDPAPEALTLLFCNFYKRKQPTYTYTRNIRFKTKYISDISTGSRTNNVPWQACHT